MKRRRERETRRSREGRRIENATNRIYLSRSLSHHAALVMWVAATASIPPHSITAPRQPHEPLTSSKYEDHEPKKGKFLISFLGHWWSLRRSV